MALPPDWGKQYARCDVAPEFAEIAALSGNEAGSLARRYSDPTTMLRGLGGGSDVGIEDEDKGEEWPESVTAVPEEARRRGNGSGSRDEEEPLLPLFWAEFAQQGGVQSPQPLLALAARSYQEKDIAHYLLPCRGCA
eukprot:SAG11_NODE_5707_length_1482_cov_1.981200_3_plen_137_part_00